ncbi:MAG: alpha-amylase family glycosyl hydrolase [Chloroflexota bacterium]|nr:alpha-amylase family glycosyl hydrolase [Chloroflexota bacterium]
MEFHVSRAARDRYGFDEELFSVTGNVLFPNFAASRRFAQAMNDRRAAELAGNPERMARAGELNAMGLIDEVLHHVVELYREQRNPQLLSSALTALDEAVRRDEVDATLRAFAERFPSVAAYRGALSADEYLAGSTAGRANREVLLEELLLNWLANENPAYERYEELFDDRPIAERTAYRQVVDTLTEFLAEEPAFGPQGEDLVSLLRKPAHEAPDSLAAQLQWLRANWGFALARLGDRLALSLDVLKEEERAEWMRFHPTAGGAGDETDASALHGFEGLDAEPERFSADLEWMPRLVLIAKSTYVWLDQLARRYGRPIWRLDQVPDEELDRLGHAGFSGLWLIGLWERSHASQRIKQLRGQPEAVASAYSLMDYAIAADLGGEEAYRNLRDRAWARGIRLASDMVPNHMGIDSRWVIEHPDWFMSRPDAPYPAYTYNGPNLSSDERVGIYIEDHYYDNSDAAVTFKRVDRWSGEERYVYHGNDGTSTPWNDTAQLDYLKPEVREAVIQTILHVARLFPVIRFDAAMTLAKRHIQRLWYPEPGSGGAIPSRAEYSMSKREFNRRMPNEFWREVVDRVAAEAPDTLLLAEAFWLMEGYFVRTLGMHRVYNSAFMNMMRDEKNAEYRLVVKNTLEFDPQILKRYVNFMNNPDEKTAVEQFGDGDKYFGVATVMTTMPGLPMFGHGQVEGFREKYGMEFRRAQLEEQPNEWLVERHEREIFPLLHRRELFAEVTDFALYDFYTTDGSVNEDVFAYSNRHGDERTLVVYHNRYAETRGWIRTAAVTGRSLGEALGLADDEARYLVLRDHRAGLEYLRSQSDLTREGLYLELGAYRCHVFIELREVVDTDGRWRRLADWLGGRGVVSVDEAMREMELAPFHAALRAALEPRVLRRVLDGDVERDGREIDDLGGRLVALATAARLQAGVEASKGTPVSDAGWAYVVAPPPAVRNYLARTVGDRSAQRAIYAAWQIAQAVDRAVPETLFAGRWLDAWRCAPVLERQLQELGLAADDAAHATAVVRCLLSLPGQDGAWAEEGDVPVKWLDNAAFRRAIGVNQHEGVEWFRQEDYERTVSWLPVARLVSVEHGMPEAEVEPLVKRVKRLKGVAERAGYRLDRLADELAAVAGRAATATRGRTE